MLKDEYQQLMLCINDLHKRLLDVEKALYQSETYKKLQEKKKNLPNWIGKNIR